MDRETTTFSSVRIPWHPGRVSRPAQGTYWAHGFTVNESVNKGSQGSVAYDAGEFVGFFHPLGDVL